MSATAADPKPKAKAKAPPAPAGVPAITRLEPRGVQRGVETRLKVVGSNLAGLTNVTFHSPKLTGALLPDAAAGEAWLAVRAAAELPSRCNRPQPYRPKPRMYG